MMRMLGLMAAALLLATAFAAAPEPDAQTTPDQTPPASDPAVDAAVGPDADAAPGTPAVKAERRVGVAPGSLILDTEPHQLEVELDAMAAAGLGWLRIDIDWSRVEASQHTYDWGITDRIVDAAARRGIRVLAMVGYTPDWLRPKGTGDKHPPIDYGTFAAFVEAAVERYHDRGVEAWEIWNEPNLRRFWEPGPDPVAYADLYRQARAAVISVDPDATVLVAGMAPAEWIDGLELPAEVFLERFTAEVPADEIDTISIHPYSFPARPGGGEPWNLFSRLPDLHHQVETAVGHDVGLWITEFGAPTGTAGRAVSPELQAELIDEALRCAASWPWVGPIFLYSMRDRPGGSPDEPEDNFGLHYADGTPKPAWTRVIEATSQTASAEGAVTPDGAAACGPTRTPSS